MFAIQIRIEYLSKIKPSDIHKNLKIKQIDPTGSYCSVIYL